MSWLIGDREWMAVGVIPDPDVVAVDLGGFWSANDVNGTVNGAVNGAINGVEKGVCRAQEQQALRCKEGGVRCKPCGIRAV